MPLGRKDQGTRVEPAIDFGPRSRITLKDVQPFFERFARNLGTHVATKWNDVGGLKLDYNPTYGGIVIEVIISEGGGVDRPFGDMRYRPAAFMDVLQFANKALEWEKQEWARRGRV